MGEEHDSWLEGIGVNVDSILQSTQDAASTAEETLQNAGSAALSSAESIAGQVQESVQDATSAATSAASNAFQTAGEVVSEGAAAVSDSANNVVEEVQQAVASAVDAGSDFVDNAIADAQEVVSDLGGALGPALSGGGLSTSLPAISTEIWYPPAVKQLPFKDWTAEQRTAGADAYESARRRELRRTMDPNVRGDTEQEERDKQVIALLDPYHDDFKKVSLGRAKIVLTSTPFGQSTQGQKILLEATIFMPEGAITPTGTIRFDVSLNKLFRQTLAKVAVNNSKASCTESKLPKGKHTFDATYTPDTTDIVGSNSEPPLDHEVV